MKLFRKKDKRTEAEVKLDEEICELMKEAYAYEDVSNVMTLMERKAQLENLKKKFKVSPDTIAVIAANLAGILLILKHEQVNVITSKAFGWILKGRV